MKHLFLIDPLEQILPKLKNDSSTLLMETGLNRGHEIFIATLKDLLIGNFQEDEPQKPVSSISPSTTFLKIRCQKVTAVDVEKGYTLGEVTVELGKDFDVIWLRKNPPFDETYLMHLAIFDQLSHHKVLFINHPQSIRALNEKLTILNFPDFITDTIVTMDIKEIYRFWQKYRKIVVKGLTGFGGDSVILIEDWQRDEEKLLQLSNNGKRFLMVQKFLANVYLGDKRISIIDGEVMGVLLRVPPKNSFIAYTGGGATVHATELTAREKMIAREVGKFLKAHNIFWAGIDLIDGYLSEINVTSPSILAAASRLMKVQLELKIWEKVEKKFQ